MVTLKKVSVFVACAIVFLGVQTVSAQLLIDFNSTTQGGGPNHEAGLQAYNAGHEVAADFDTKSYDVVFSSGNATVTVTPDWPNTTDRRVRQMIDRGAGNDAQWLGDNIDLLTDWIGADSRTGNGGNGDWDRTADTSPTYMTLALGGLPAGNYNWLSYHHDTENIWSDFQVELSTDGGATFGAPIDSEMTSSSTGGNPTNPATSTGGADADPKNLSSTLSMPFTADGVNDVVLRFAPFADGVDGVAVHKQFVAVNGFVVSEAGPSVAVPALSTWGLVSLALVTLFVGAFSLSRRRLSGCFSN